MNKVLIIDPSVSASLNLAMEVKKEFKIDVLIANTFEQTVDITESQKRICVAIVDPILIDSSEVNVIDYILNLDIPVIVYSSSLKVDVLKEIDKRSIVDYLIKSNRDNSSIIMNLIANVIRNIRTAVLIIDNSSSIRELMELILGNLDLKILQADSVESGLRALKEHPEIKLVLTDFSMEGENGIDLTRIIRKTYSNKEVSIIGHSSYGNPMLSADFIKNGANDFINKPFQKEELINKVLLQLDMISYISKIKDSSQKDFLTFTYNRRYIYEVGRKLFNNAQRGNLNLVCAIIDIDNFKKINDTYGYDIGEKAIVHLSNTLCEYFRKSDIVGRLGGDEFCVVLTNPDEDKLENIFENIRKKVQEIVISGEDEDKNKFDFGFTISIGVASILTDSFDEMLKSADMKLYEAKKDGKNIVVI